jgi:YegS/Rv2252/BmrU family lipid kinase
MAKKVHIIVNPASGQPQPVLHTLNSVFHPAGIDWDVFITKQSGDALRYAREAVEAGVDVVAANGGDGTVMEVAHGVKGTSVPMAILPGGTANLVSVELGIPKDLQKAIELIASEDSQVRKVDMGKIGDEYFLLRVGMGIAAEKVRIADREMKDRFGLAAYTIAGVQAIIGSEVARYNLTLDGQKIESEGVTCIIDNAGNMGVSDIKPARDVDMSDGLLDVILVHDLGAKAVTSAFSSIAGRSPDPTKVQHWQARHITIETDPPLNVQVDGEMRGQTPITVEVIPAVVGVLTPG